jgi:hypothetical protein
MAEATTETPETPQKVAADIVQEPVPSPLEPASEFQVLNSHLEEAAERLARSTHLNPQSLRDWLVNDLCPIFGDMMKASEWYVLDLNMRAAELEDQESADSLTPELGAQIIEFIGRTVQFFGAIAPMLQAQNPALLEELQLLVAVAPGLLSNVQDAIVLEEAEDEDEEYDEDEEGEEGEEDEEEGEEEAADEEAADEAPAAPAAEPPAVEAPASPEPPAEEPPAEQNPAPEAPSEEPPASPEPPAEEGPADEAPAAAEPVADEATAEAPADAPEPTEEPAPAEPMTAEPPTEEPENKPEEGSDG